MVANLLIAARAKAAATGQPTRLLLNFNADPATASHFLRRLVLQVQTSAGWEVVSEVILPEGVCVLPGNVSTPVGLFDVASNWTRSDGAALRSTAFRSGNVLQEAIASPVVENWLFLPFAAIGTTNAAGDIVLAPSRPRPPSAFGAGASPVELYAADAVRGVAISTYGVTTLINERAGF